MRVPYRLFIPTRDSARWIGNVIDFYSSRGLSPFIVIDKRTQDNTREIVASKGIEYKEFCPRSDYPEAGMLEFAAQNANSDWILRLDDDELPSQFLLDFVSSVGIKSKNQCYYIERRELSWDNGRVVYSRSPGKYPLPDYPQYLQPMARLFHVDRVEYLEEVHTTGLQNLKLYGFAPPQAFIVHLNCLVHDFNMRLNKILAYEEIKPNVAWALADEYLPELFDADYHNYTDQGLEEFLEFFQILDEHKKPGNEEISRVDIDHARLSVAARAEKILSARASSLGGRLTADDVSWIEYLPQSTRLPLAKFLCSVSDNRLNKIGMALWDYLEVHNGTPQSNR